MAQLKDLIVNGPSRFIGDVYATTFTGNLEGNASTATSATTAEALTGKTLVTASAVTTSNWSTYGNNHIPTMSFMAYWNGAYSGTSSNLTYCAQGTIIGSKNIGSQSVNFATSSGSCSGNAATATDSDTLDGYHAASFVKISSLSRTNLLLSDKVFSVGTAGKGDFPEQTECPTPYGAYISIQYNASMNQGYQLYGDTFSNGALYARWRKAGNSNTTYKDWKQVAFITDNVASASKWANARTITLTGSVTGSVSIDGSSNVSLATTTNHTHTFDSLTSKPTTISGYGITDALTTSNYNSYSPKLDGTGASGTWGISITGSAGSVAWSNVTGKPNTFTPATHTHTFASLTSKPTTLDGYGITDAYTKTETNTKLSGYLPLTGGTINGNLQIGANDNTSYKCLILVRSGRFIRINNTDKKAYFAFGTKSDTGSLTDERILTLGDDGLRYSPNASAYYDILHTGNYNSYSPKLDGTGATGTWNINISGNAATATKATQDGNGNVITSTYLPVSSGTINAICTTIASVGAKKAASHNFILTTGVSILITFTVSNTHQNKMTLNVNETGAKTLYINDKVSSTTNYTIPAGTYNCYYNGSYWDLDTGNAFKAETFIVSQLKAASGYCLLYGSTVANAALHIGVISPNTSYPYTTYSLYMARKGIAVGGFASTSDMTMKDRIEDLRLNFDDVASMPVFKFRWKDSEAHGDNINIGTSAQYWVSKEPLLVDGTEGSYSIQYGVLALACVKTTAEKVKELEDKVLELQEEIKTLKAL